MEDLSFSKIDLCLPSYLISSIRTVDDIVFMGRLNIEQAISWQVRRKNSADYWLKEVEARIKLCEGKAAADFQQLATEFENPTFPSIGFRPDSIPGLPEPLDSDSLNRKIGSTTFNVCGWCNYRGEGTYRFRRICMSADCGLLADAKIEHQKRTFNTPCALLSADEALFDQLRAGLATLRLECLEVTDLLDGVISNLEELKNRSEQKPVLPWFRQEGYFKLGQQVFCCVGAGGEVVNAVEFLKNNFVPARVFVCRLDKLSGMSVCCDSDMPSHGAKLGDEKFYGYQSSEVMHLWEYEYFQNHPKYAVWWFDLVASRNKDTA